MMTLSARANNPTAQKLYAALEDLGVPLRTLGEQPQDDDHVVCWGTPWSSGLNGRGQNINKYVELIRMHSYGLPVPAYSQGPREGYIGRTLYHSRGTDFPNQPGRRYDYYVLKYPILQEYRVHSFWGNPFCVQVKVQARDGRPVYAWPRTHTNGWIFKTVVESPGPVRDLARRALHALKLDFGAVDIIHVGEDDYRVLEVNRTPGLSPSRVRSYAEQFSWWYRHSLKPHYFPSS